MVARAILSFHPAPFHASGESPAKSNYSRTYGIPRGGGYTGFLVRPIPKRPFLAFRCWPPTLSSPPCSTSSFPLQWGYPFPVITGENQ